MTRDELYSVARRLYDAAYGVIIGPTGKGGTMNEIQPENDPRDAEIAALRQQLAEAEAANAAKAAAGTQATENATGGGADVQPAAGEPAPPADVSYEDAKAKVDKGEELTDADVAALERGPAV